MRKGALEGLDVRRYRPGDERDIVELFRLVFHKKLSIDEWRWKYDQNPYPNKMIMLCYAGDGRLAAHCAGIPSWARVDGRQAVFIQTVDAMSHPHYRRGAFVRTVRAAMNEFRSPDALFFGFPDPRHLRLGELKLGYRNVCLVPEFVRSSPLLHGEEIPDGSDEIVREVTCFGREADELWTSCQEDYSCAVVRNSAYLNWRYRDCPRRRYRMFAIVASDGSWKGWAVFSRERATAVLVDMLVTKPYARSATGLIASALREYRRDWALWCRAWIPPCSPARESLRCLGFRPVSRHSGLALTVQPDISGAMPVNVESEFYYQMGDSDMF